MIGPKTPSFSNRYYYLINHKWVILNNNTKKLESQELIDNW